MDLQFSAHNLSEIIDRHKDSQKLAVLNIADDSKITYAELYSAVISLSVELQRRGVKKGDTIIVQRPKSIEVIIAAFAIFKCGGVFVPVDIDAPTERLRQIIAQSESVLVLSDNECIDGFTGEWANIEVLLGSVGNIDSSEIVSVPISPNDPAYVIFTSGSTGVAKGVVIPHVAAIAFLSSAQKVVQYQEDLRYLNTAPFFFDASILDIYLPLYLGGELFLLPKVVFPSDIARAIEAYRITDTLMVSSVLKLLVNRFSDARKRDLSSLRSVWYGAEPCPISVLKTIRGFSPKLRFIHGYGPTEATHTTLLYLCEDLDQESCEYLPLGTPLETIDVLLVDEDHQPIVGAGVGELFIRGKQLMLGYINDSVNTQSAFMEVNDHNYYRSRDLVRRDEGGDLWFVGRKDNAIKVKGMLVHLDEVETTALGVQGVEYAYATHIEHELHGKQISLFLAVESAVDEKSVRAHLSDFLPAYMLPSVIKIISASECKFLPSGKLDRKWMVSNWQEAGVAS